MASGHAAFTVTEAGISGSLDASVAEYAWVKALVLVTNDKEFARKLRSDERLHGNVVFLDCIDTRAREYLEGHVESVVDLLEARPLQRFRIVRMTAEGASIWYPPYLSSIEA